MNNAGIVQIHSSFMDRNQNLGAVLAEVKDLQAANQNLHEKICEMELLASSREKKIQKEKLAFQAQRNSLEEQLRIAKQEYQKVN